MYQGFFVEAETVFQFLGFTLGTVYEHPLGKSILAIVVLLAFENSLFTQVKKKRAKVLATYDFSPCGKTWRKVELF